jgi:hypothetical protein
MRYCNSKASTEVLVAMAEGHEQTVETLKECHAKVFEIAETAMKQALRGNATGSVELLIQQGENTRNSKLIDMALSVLKRHEEKIDDASAMELRIGELQDRWVKPLGASVGRARQAGGVALRG